MSNDFWDSWSGGDFEPIPAGNYAVELVGVEVKEGFSGHNQTELTLRLCPDQPRAGKLLWVDWPMEGPNVEKLGWIARMAYETLVGPGRPAGETPKAALQSVAADLRSNVGSVVTATVGIREYTTKDGDRRRVNQIKRLVPFQPAVVPPPHGAYHGGAAPTQAEINNGLAGLRAYGQGDQAHAPNPAAQPSPYGGHGYAAQQGQNGGSPWSS